VIVCIPTIKHSGTHLLKNDIFKAFKNASYVQALDGGCDDGDYSVTWHVVGQNFDTMAEVMDLGIPIISPMRHPARVKESYIRRGMYPPRCDSQSFDTQWKNMIKIYEKYDPMYIHIDSENRDSDVLKVASKISRDLHTDWPLLGATHGVHDFKVTDDSIKGIPNWVMDFYNSIK
jgi:hypothetical protein